MLLMRSLLLAATLLLPIVTFAQSGAPAKDLAPTPPMGWNSWDAYGTTIDETSFRANAEWIAKHLKPFGYQYVTIDEGWYEPRASAAANSSEQLVIDQYGRFIPALDRFPSAANGAGFTPLADYIHSLGLKFGIHVLQGIPRKAVAENLPIEGSGDKAKEAANPFATCQWDTKNWDLQDNEAAQAYYDSIVRLYASWHVDLIKIDCIASRPYKGEEIRMFHEAIAKSGAPMVLSLSPGPAPMNEAANLEAYSQQWRISDDVWDVWQSTGAFPQGLNDQIARAAKWLPYAGIQDGQGHWPDSDMLAIGNLRPSPGWGQPRASRLTPDEQRSMIDLWSIVRSPLVYGGDPLTTDAATLALLTNPDVIQVDQHSRDNKNVILTHDLAVYTARPASGSGAYVAIFNREDKPQEITLTLAQLGLEQQSSVAYDLWSKKRSAPVNQVDQADQAIHLTLAAHASTILLVAPIV
jgi:alpha-galactosidase